MAIHFKSENLQKHAELASKIKNGLIVEANIIKEAEPHSVYDANLPEGIEKKHIEEIAKYNSKFVTAAHLAVGELAAGVFIADKSKKIETVEAEIGFFGKTDVINISVAKERTFQNHLSKDPSEKEVTKHLVMQTTVTSTSVRGSGLKSVRDTMSAEFADMFKK